MTVISQPVALITGASSGIGRASAVALQQAGYRVFGTSRKTGGTVPQGVTMLVADVTREPSVQQMVQDVMTAAGRIDLLVNNAGYALSGAAEESSIAQVQALFDTNVHGVIRVTNAVLPIMRAQGTGRILNIGSVLGLIPGPFGAYCAASKHAIEGYSESLDHEVRPFGIRVAVIEPWATKKKRRSRRIRPKVTARLLPMHRPWPATARPLMMPWPKVIPPKMSPPPSLPPQKTARRACDIRRARPHGKHPLPGAFCPARFSTAPCANSSTSPEA